MTKENIVISLDCMGGEKAPEAIIKGASLILQEKKNIKFLLYGDSKKIEKVLNKEPLLKNLSEVHHTNGFISSSEKPSIALRKSKNSSMRLAVEAVKNNEADAIISAGNTGALMAISKVILRTLPDIDRPALIQLIPNRSGKVTALLDMGANIDCDSVNLCQFAIMGLAYYSAVTGVKNPSIGLLNVGSEEMKGNDSVKNAAIMLKDSELKNNFYGFIEGDDILKGVVDIVVTDGFSGNIALKSIEGTAKFFSAIMTEAYSSNLISKLGYLLSKSAIKKAKKKTDPRTHNGAMFVGLNGICIKSHGNADELAFYSAIKHTISLIEGEVNKEIINFIHNSDFNEELN